jgi:hypothetical protein
MSLEIINIKHIIQTNFLIKKRCFWLHLDEKKVSNNSFFFLCETNITITPQLLNTHDKIYVEFNVIINN